MGKKEELYEKALEGKKIPVLTLDNKWYKLFPNLNECPKILNQARNLNDLLKRQGKLNTETKEIKNIKMRLMQEIVPMVDELEQTGDKSIEKKINSHKRLIEESNSKMEAYQEELLELPKQIDTANQQLMLFTMEYCYDSIQANTEEIVEISKWVAQIREELKQRLVRKQEKEIYNRQMYAYMHDIFGPDVIEMFDLKYNPLEQAPKNSEENT